MRRLIRDTTGQSLVAALVTVIVGWSGPNVLLFSLQASAHLSMATMMSWLWGFTVFAALAGITLSLRLRTPVLVVWSTPGLAFLVTAMPGFTMAEAVGAFLVSAVLVTTLGLFRPFMLALQRIPLSLAAALNAAILMPFAFALVRSVGALPVVVAAMLITYLIARQLHPRWAVAWVLLSAVIGAALTGSLHPVEISWAPTQPHLVLPHFTVRAIVSLALPLTLLAFTGQFLPGLGVLRTNGFPVDLGRVMPVCGVASIGAAFFGCHNLTLTTLLGNIVAGPEAGPDSGRRYPAAVWAACGNLVVGLFAGTTLQIMSVLPPAALTALAGLALLSALTAALVAAFAAPSALVAPSQLATQSQASATPLQANPLPAVAVLVVALSGIHPGGLDSAFWGILAGLAVAGVQRSLAAHSAPARV